MWKNKLSWLVFFAMLIPAGYSWAAGSAAPLTIPNPISSNSFPALVNNLSRAIMTVVLPISVVAIIWAGLKMVIASAQAKPEEVKKARSMLGWIIVGTVIIVGSSLLTQAIINFATNL